MKNRRITGVWAALLVLAVSSLAFAGSATAKLTGEFTKFAQCPTATEAVTRCLYSVTSGGEVVLGSKKVPIVNPVSSARWLRAPNFDEESPEFLFSKFYAASNGITLSEASQPVPGG